MTLISSLIGNITSISLSNNLNCEPWVIERSTILALDLIRLSFFLTLKKDRPALSFSWFAHLEVAIFLAISLEDCNNDGQDVESDDGEDFIELVHRAAPEEEVEYEDEEKDCLTDIILI